MAKTSRPCVPEQDLRLPPRLRDWLPESHLAFFVSNLIDQWICRPSRACMRTRNRVPAVSPRHVDEGPGYAGRPRGLQREQDQGERIEAQGK